MNNKLLFSSLIITAMLFSNVNSAFSVSDDLTFNMPSYTGIEVDSSSVVSGSATRTSATSISLDSSFNIAYNVSTNEEVVVGIAASVPVENNSIEKTGISNGYLVFTKADGTTTRSAVQNITYGTPNATNNPNAIAFPISCTQGDYVNGGWINGDRNNFFDGLSEGFIYSVNGTKEISCTINGNSLTNTAAMNDTPGDYSATLTLTQVSVYGQD